MRQKSTRRGSAKEQRTWATEKRKLRLQNADEIAAEVRRLRRRIFKGGELVAAAGLLWPLNTIMTFTMSPGPHAPIQVDAAAKARLAQILREGEVPQIKAPERVVPPEQVGDEIIEQFLATLERLKGFGGPFAPHRLFGEMPHEDYVRMHMIHASHHLGHLVPTDG